MNPKNRLKMAEPTRTSRDFNTLPPVSQPGGIAARARAAAPYLADLNPEQRAAVETLDGPVLVLAGAGTGKTRVLTTRIAHILATGRARPSEILSVTFTNKAAREMKLRVGAMVGQIVEGMPWLGTFHSIGVKILRRHAELAGLKPDFTILDTDDQIRLMRQILEAEDIDEKRWPARMLAGLIDSWKNRGLAPDQVPAGEGASFANGKGRKLYVAYQERLKVLNAADFGDLLLECIRLFRTQPEVLRQYQARFKYILVDEYQDTNVAQYLWLRLLGQSTGLVLRDAARSAAPEDEDQPHATDREATATAPDDPHPEERGSTPRVSEGEASPPRTLKNICCVGDDDQSIYGWRGAEVDNILRFEHDFPGAKVIRLERNYRSTAHILAAASHLIAHNEGRLGKTLRTEDVPGEKVTVTGSWDSEEEARAIGEEIEELQRGGHRLDEIAILVRASFQMREFEDRFVTLGLPYRVIGGPRFYERQEIRDALAYLRLIAQPADDLAFERIVNVPKRGLGDATVKLLHEHARRRRISLMQATRALIETDELKPRPRGALRDLVAAFDRWRAQKDALPHTELTEIVLDESGYTEMWQKDRSADAAGRLGKSEGADPLHGGVREPARFPRAYQPGHGHRQERERRGRVGDDPAFRQGPGVRHRVPARLGGRPVPASADPGRSGPRRARGGAPPRPCRDHARAPPCQDLFRHQPAHARAVAEQHSVALPRRAARGQRRGDGIPGRLRGLWRIRGLALRRDDPFRVELRHSRLAARAAPWRRFRGSAGTSTPIPPPRRSPGGKLAAARRRDPMREDARPGARLRSPSRASWSRARAARPPPSRSATACSTSSSATATSPRSTATSSPSSSTRPARSAWWIASWSGCSLAPGSSNRGAATRKTREDPCFATAMIFSGGFGEMGSSSCPCAGRITSSSMRRSAE